MASWGLTRSLAEARFRRASSVLAAISVSFRLNPSFFISSSATMSSLSRSAVHGSWWRMVLVDALGRRIFCTTDALCDRFERSATVSRVDSFLEPAMLSLRWRSCAMMALRLEAELLRRRDSR